MAFKRTINPPAKLRYQKETGMTLSFFFSEAIPWTMNLMVNITDPMKPKTSQKSKSNFGYLAEKSLKQSSAKPRNVRHSILNPFLNIIVDGAPFHPSHG